ncbi:MAG: radical SAM protein [Planctomycetota bacterium]
MTLNDPDDPYTTLEKQSLQRYTPLRAMIELTYRCNFRCVMCYLVEFRSPGEMSTAEVKEVIDQLAAMGCLVLTFTGGEPLLRKDFFELAQYARERRFGLRVFTNGLLIDEECADRFAEIRPLSTEISVYGASDATYEQVTGRKGAGRHERVLNAIRMLRERDLPVQVKVPVLQQNYADLEQIRAFADDVGAGLAANPNITPKDNGDLTPLQHGLDDASLEEYYRSFVRPREEPQRSPDDLMCNTARNSMVISPVGDVFPCVQIKRSVGNIREHTLTEIWSQSPLLDRLRTLRVRDYTGCSGCGKKQKHAQCAGIAAAMTGSFTGGDPLAHRLSAIRDRAHPPMDKVSHVERN